MKAGILSEWEGEELIRQAQILISQLSGKNAVDSNKRDNHTACNLLENVLNQVENFMQTGIMQENEVHELIIEAQQRLLTSCQVENKD